MLENGDNMLLDRTITDIPPYGRRNIVRLGGDLATRLVIGSRRLKLGHMKLHPRVTRSVLELVKRFEGLRRRAARLPNGGWTIGYGHTRSAREGAVVSPEDADALLYYDLSEVAEKVEAWTFTPLNQNQFEALTAFAFNIGIDNFRRSTVLKRVNEGQHLTAAAALELWRKSDFGGEDLVIDALVRRRAAEKAHYLTPPEGYRPSPTPVLKPAFDHSVIEAAASARLGRPAAVVDAPLDGDRAFATVEPAVEVAPQVETGPERQTTFPLAAAATATGVATARLHQLYPDKSAKADADTATGQAQFVLNGDQDRADHDQPPAPNGDRLVDEAAADHPPQAPMRAPPSFEPVPALMAFGGFAPPPVRRLETSVFEPAERPTMKTDERWEEIAAPEPDDAGARAATLFDAPAFDVRAPRRFDGAQSAAADDSEIVNGHPPGPLHSRSLIYFSVGLLGVALFAAALFSMFTGKASPVNLVVGLMGILLMTPAGGYFLLRFFDKRDDLAAT
jgi:lysozyme